MKMHAFRKSSFETHSCPFLFISTTVFVTFSTTSLWRCLWTTWIFTCRFFSIFLRTCYHQTRESCCLAWYNQLKSQVGRELFVRRKRRKVRLVRRRWNRVEIDQQHIFDAIHLFINYSRVSRVATAARWFEGLKICWNFCREINPSVPFRPIQSENRPLFIKQPPIIRCESIYE